MLHRTTLSSKIKMSSQKSSAATNNWQTNFSTIKCPRPLWAHNWNHNNKYSSLSQSFAQEQGQRQSYVSGHSSLQLGIKKQSHLAPDNVPETLQLVSLQQETTAPYLPPTLLNYFHSQGHTENDSLMQPSPETYIQDNTMNASSRQETPSTLNQWSSVSEARPSFSKFTLGLSPSIFHSLLFPQQVAYQKHKNPHTSSHSLKYSNARRDNFDTRIRSTASAYDKPEYAYRSTRSSTSSRDENEDPDTSIRSSTSSYDEHEDLNEFGDSFTSSCDEEETPFSPTVRYQVDSATLFGDLDYNTPPPAPKGRRMKKVVRRPPKHSSVSSRQQSLLTPSSVGASQQTTSTPSFAGIRQESASTSSSGGARKQYVSIRFTKKQKPILPPEVRKEKQRTKFRKQTHSRNFQRDLLADTPRRANPESAYLSDLRSPSRDPSSPSTQESSSPHGTACGGFKPPCLKLSTKFNEDQPTFTSAKTVTGNEFYHFIAEKNLSSVMFYMGHKTTKDTLKVWDREAREKISLGDRNYGFVDCDTEPALCAREHISKIPFYKIFFGGHPIAAGPHFKLLRQPDQPKK